MTDLECTQTLRRANTQARTSHTNQRRGGDCSLLFSPLQRDIGILIVLNGAQRCEECGAAAGTHADNSAYCMWTVYLAQLRLITCYFHIDFLSDTNKNVLYTDCC